MDKEQAWWRSLGGPSPPQKERFVPTPWKFAFGGLAGMAATCVVQPLDLIRTRMQLYSGGYYCKTTFEVAREIVACEGFITLYEGLSAGLLRQATYASARFGVYNYLFDRYKKQNNCVPPSLSQKILYGATAGFVGGFVGVPTEVAFLRTLADNCMPSCTNYKNIFDAHISIVRQEGILKLWRGGTPIILRAMIVNAVQFSTYWQAREMLVGTVANGVPLQICSAMVSGLVTSIVAMPADIIKWRIQNSCDCESKGAVVRHLLRSEGILSLWRGFLPYYARLGTHTVLTFMILEQLNIYYFNY